MQDAIPTLSSDTFRLHASVNSAIEAAYLLGRVLREAEVVADHEAGAARGKQAKAARDAGTAAMREKAEKWKKSALEVATHVRKVNPTLSQQAVAVKIEGALIDGLPDRPRIVAVISGWEGLWRKTGGKEGLQPRHRPEKAAKPKAI